MNGIRNLLGLIDDDKRVYLLEEGEVDRSEFEYSQVMFNYLFDEEKGVVATLGPTWNLIHDPRFARIEMKFIRSQKNVFSAGSTLLGQKIISSAFSGLGSDVSQLEQYAMIIGEGRHFHAVLSRGEARDEDGDVLVPTTFYQDSPETIWKVIRQECPNYFTREGHPNLEAGNLYNSFREDLLGLIDDYAEVPLVDEYVNSETGDVFEPKKWDGETPIVYVEVDLLEKALTVRGSLRVIAAKILNRLGFTSEIQDGRLTSMEIDVLLRRVYESNWPEDRMALALGIKTFIQNCLSINYETRLREQLASGRASSKRIIADIRSGAVKQINRVTDPGVEDEAMDADAVIIRSIQENHWKASLFQIFTDAERTRETRITELLEPVFASTSFDVTEDVYQQFIGKIRGFGVRPGVTTVEGYLNPALDIPNQV